jgi:hypothetical protein
MLNALRVNLIVPPFAIPWCHHKAIATFNVLPGSAAAAANQSRGIGPRMNNLDSGQTAYRPVARS